MVGIDLSVYQLRVSSGVVWLQYLICLHIFSIFGYAETGSRAKKREVFAVLKFHFSIFKAEWENDYWIKISFLASAFFQFDSDFYFILIGLVFLNRFLDTFVGQFRSSFFV